ncbi:MAG: DUF3592 domain-containing protein [Hydrogenophaga sp.]
MIISLMGAVLLAIGVFRINTFRRAKKWTCTDGLLLKFRIAVSVEPGRFYNQHHEHPVAEYEYRVDGKSYIGTRVGFEVLNDRICLPGEVRPPWTQWRVGIKVEVYFDPNRPESSVLIPKIRRTFRSHLLALVISGLLLIAFSIGMAVLGA